MFKYTLDNKRYHTLNYFFRQKFKQKVVKIPIDIDAYCPNFASGGCIFCKNRSKANIIIDEDDIIKQFNNTVKVYDNKWPNSLYIPYFQAGTNTALPVSKLKPIITRLLKIPKVVGIAIATRPDAISESWYNYLNELNNQTFLMVELGLQSSNEATLKLINRGHDVKTFKDTVLKLHSYHIFVVAHIINGLPFEAKEDMVKTAKFLNSLNIDALKIHMLYIIKDTPLANLYKTKPFHILTKEEYIDIVCTQLSYLKPEIVLERITGDPDESLLVAPLWLTKKFVVLNDIDKEMQKRNLFQGDNLQSGDINE